MGVELSDQKVGIIGRGNVGSRLQKLLDTLGVESVANDPPLSDSGVTGLVSLHEALAQDIISLHVPLNREGAYPTCHLMNESNLASMRNGALLVNCARGDVVDGEAVLKPLNDKRLLAAFDVWPNEPKVDRELVALSQVATPHVAGYSDDGKHNGARLVYREFCAWSGQPENLVEPLPGVSQALSIEPDRNVLDSVLDQTCFVRTHDKAMKRMSQMTGGEAAIEFDRLRRDYPIRRDFHAWNINCSEPSEAEILRNLGFAVPQTESPGS